MVTLDKKRILLQVGWITVKEKGLHIVGCRLTEGMYLVRKLTRAFLSVNSTFKQSF